MSGVCCVGDAYVCVCVSHSVPKRPITIIAGGQPREHSRLPNEEDYATTAMGLITSTYLLN